MLFIIFLSLFTASDNCHTMQARIAQQPHAKKKKTLEETLKKHSPPERQAMYGRLRTNIAAKQLELGEKRSVSEARDYISHVLTDSIFPHWYNTEWDFNGTTQVPQEGSIACGYFVSTTLQHAGFNLDRVKCGQQASSVFINAMCEKSSIKWITGGNVEKLVKHMELQPDGLYLLGLDYHTGFIQKDGKDLWMIHAAYKPDLKVMKERLQGSKYLKDSNIYMVGNLLGNDALIKKWMSKEKIVIE